MGTPVTSSVSAVPWTPEDWAEMAEEVRLKHEGYYAKTLPFIQKKQEGKKEFYYIDGVSEPSENEHLFARIQESLTLGKTDNLFLVLITIFFSSLSLVNILLGVKALTWSLVLLPFILLVPFYVGFIKGALMDDMRQRIIGWDLLFVEMIASGIFVSGSIVFNLRIAWLFGGAPVSFLQSLGSLVLLLVSLLATVWLKRFFTLKIAQFYFDKIPSHRAKTIEACGLRGDDNPVEHIMPAMLKKKDLEFHWLFKGHVFVVRQGLIECRNLISSFVIDPVFFSRYNYLTLVYASLFAWALLYSAT